MKTKGRWNGYAVNMAAPEVVLTGTNFMDVTAVEDATGNGQSWAQTTVTTVPGRRYVFSAYLLKSDTTTFPRNRVLAAMGDNILGESLFDVANKRYTMEFVAETASTTIRFYAPSTTGSTATYGAPIVASDSDYEYLTDTLGLKYFDYSTMPLPR